MRPDAPAGAPAMILLAPMEGQLDHSLRDELTSLAGIDRCVSEFIRITDWLLPPRVFLRLMPELRTAAGLPRSQSGFGSGLRRGEFRCQPRLSPLPASPQARPKARRAPRAARPSVLD